MRDFFLRIPLLALAVLLATVVLPACAPKTPEERAAQLRSFYKARLNGFIVQEEPVEAATEMDELEMADQEVIGEAEGAKPIEMAPVEQKILLDILIQHRSHEKLAGVTVDISMVGPDEQEKGHWRVWFDTSNIAQATPTQFTHILEGVPYEEGDGFHAEVRHPVPPEERSDYREFSSAT